MLFIAKFLVNIVTHPIRTIIQLLAIWGIISIVVLFGIAKGWWHI